MHPWSCFLPPPLCLLPIGAAPGRWAPSSANCELKAQQSELNFFLWTIMQDPPSYFFSAIHVPYMWVWDFIPDNSKEDFQQSSIMYFELDLTDPYTSLALTSCQVLPQGARLQDIYCCLKRHLEYVKLMLPSWVTPDQVYADYLFNAITGNWEHEMPIWVMLMVNSLTKGDIKSHGVPVLELYLAQEAKQLWKQTGVEKVEEQCHPLNGLNFSQVFFALNTLLEEESLWAGSLQIPYIMEDLIKHSICGDLISVIFSHNSSQVPNFIDTMLPPQECIIAQETDSYFWHELIYSNERMGHRVKALLEELLDQGFFAFGAAHLPEVLSTGPSEESVFSAKAAFRSLEGRVRLPHLAHGRVAPQTPSSFRLLQPLVRVVSLLGPSHVERTWVPDMWELLGPRGESQTFAFLACLRYSPESSLMSSGHTVRHWVERKGSGLWEAGLQSLIRAVRRAGPWDVIVLGRCRKKIERPSLQHTPSAIFALEVSIVEALAPKLSVVPWQQPPQVSLPGSADLLGEEDQKFWKKWRHLHRRQRLRQFSDLWVGLEERAVVPQLQVPVLDRHISAQLWFLCHGLSHHSQMVASSACLSLWTDVFWVMVLAFQTQTLLR
ncbi:LOW QUALITY PROTEIN: metalloprotease TIKI1 [Erethizon dorsatum]